MGVHYNTGTGGAAGYQAVVLADKPYMYWRMDTLPYTTPPASAYPTALNYGTGNSINGLYLSSTVPGSPGPALPGMGSPSYACAFNGLGNDSANAIPIYTNGVVYATNTVAETGVLITNLINSMNQNVSNFTLAYWFKLNPSDNQRGVTVGHGDSAWRSSISGGAVTANTGKGSDISSGLTYNDGNWHFAAIVYTNSNVHFNTTGWLATNLVYVDGNLLSVAADTNAVAAGSLTNIEIGVAPDHVRTGSANTYDNQVLPGSVAHVAFFTNALTQAQIVNLYTNATGAMPIAPIITGQPFPSPSFLRPVNAGPGVFIFEAVTATGGSPNLGYQWYYNTSSNAVGAVGLVDTPGHYTNSQTSQVSITIQGANDTGFYFCIVSNNFGTATSAIVNVQVSTQPQIVAQSPSGAFSFFPNQTFPLSVTTTGGTPQAFQWYTNGVADTTFGTNATYSSVATASGATYQLIVTNIYGSATSVLSTLTLLSLPATLTNSLYGSNVLALSPSGYWPLHETTTPSSLGPVETNLGTLGNLANAYYADWTGNLAPTGIVRQVTGALANDPDTAVGFNDFSDNGSVNYPGFMVIPRTSPATTLKPPFTIELWAKPYNSGFGDMVSENGSQNGVNNQNDGVRLSWGSGTGGAATQAFNAFIGNGTARNSFGGVSATLVIGQWYHVALTYDGNNWIIYVNGNVIVNQPTTATFTLSPDTGSPICIAQGLWAGTGPGRGLPMAPLTKWPFTTPFCSKAMCRHIITMASPGALASISRTMLSLSNPLIYLRMDAPPVHTAVARNRTWSVAANYGSAGGNGLFTPGSIPGLVSGPQARNGIPNNKVMPGNGMGAFVDAGNAATFNPTGGTAFSYGAWFRGNPADTRSTNTIIGRSDNSIRAFITGSGKVAGPRGE